MTRLSAPRILFAIIYSILKRLLDETNPKMLAFLRSLRLLLVLRPRQFVLVALFGCLVVAGAGAVEKSSVVLTPEEAAWVAAHRETVFSVGFDPYAGMDVFDFQGRRTGFLPALLEDMQAQLGLRLALAEVKTWNDAYRAFEHGRIDVLYGANPTPEREELMVFTRPALRYPYVVFAHRDSPVQTLGDLDGKRVGFIANDFVSRQLPLEYHNIAYAAEHYADQERGLKALAAKKIQGFITSGGGVEREYLTKYPELVVVAELKAITSDMTFAVLWETAILGRIIDKYVEQRKAHIEKIAGDVERVYTRKLLKLTEAELAWLERKGEAVVGVADDYLPFDHYANGEYRGIVGETLKAVSDIIGIRFKVEHGPFAEIYEKARSGAIDVVNIAKTEDRLQYFLYPRPICRERDIIVGRKTSPPVQDVYGLDGLSVAVIDGFWHEEYLRKNLKNPRITKTDDIVESLRLLREGKVDYMIENPTVVEYYINGLGFTDLVKRGGTSKDSFVYFGVNRQQPELASIIDKVLPLINYEDMKYAGMQSVPTLRNEESRQLGSVVIGLALALGVILFVTVRIVRSLSDQKAQTRFLKEREQLLYTDVLTGFHNRNYFGHNAEALQKGEYPQAILVADLNNLKRVNDAYGHAAGDALLRLFAAYIRELFPEGNVFRIGGDEFIILLDRTSKEAALKAIEALQAKCDKVGYTVKDGQAIHPSAAMGYAIRNHDQERLDDLIARADERMYQAKARMKKRRSDRQEPVPETNDDQ